MKPVQVAVALRHIAAKLEASERPDRTLVVSALQRVLAAMAPGVTFYIDWEGRGYSPEDMQADIDAMRSRLGEGPVFSGASIEFDGHFFSAQPLVGSQILKIRGGVVSDGSAYDAPDITWTEHANWDVLVTDLQLFT